MYLHIGGDTAINMKDVVAVFDMDNTTVTQRSRRFLSECDKRCEIIDVTDDLPKSYIVTSQNGVQKVYISSLSPQTLLKRAKK